MTDAEPLTLADYQRAAQRTDRLRASTTDTDEMRVATPTIRSAPVVSVHVPKAGEIGAAPVCGR